MKTHTINLYDYEELAPKAKEKALFDFVTHHDDPMLQPHLGNLLKEELEERKIKYDVDSIEVFYSLSHNQGDGLMFEGTLEDTRGNPITIKHSGHYYHSNSREIDYPAASEREYADFEKVYAAICKKVELAEFDAECEGANETDLGTLWNMMDRAESLLTEAEQEL